MPSFTISVGQIIGNYRVVRLLGEGGMGAVYEAVHTTLNRRCAIKVLHPQFAGDPIVAARFLQEAKAANLVQHPGVVQIFEFGQFAEGPAYFVMEFLEGDTLSTRIRWASQQPAGRLGLPGLATCWAIAKVCSAVHKQGLVHRDLKPANIMIVPDPDVAGGERIKVLDFGIVKATQGGDEGQGPADIKTRTGSMMGTPQYMAPEQWRGYKNIDSKADVYALGIILYLVVSGRLPFDHDDLPVLGMMHCFNEPPLLTDLDPNLPSEVAELASRMLEKDPIKRPSMAEVTGALKHILGVMADGEHRPLSSVRAALHPPILGAKPGAKHAASEPVAHEGRDGAVAATTSTSGPTAGSPAEITQRGTSLDSDALLKKRAATTDLPEQPRDKSGSSMPADVQPLRNAPLRAPSPLTPKQVLSSTAPTLPPPHRRSWRILLLLALGLSAAVGAWRTCQKVRSPLSGMAEDLGSGADMATVKTSPAPEIADFAHQAPAPPDLAILPDFLASEPSDLGTAELPPDMARRNRLPPKSCVPNLPTESCVIGSNLTMNQRELIVKAFKRSAAKLCVGERLVLTGLPQAPRASTVPPSMERASGTTRALTLTLRGLLGSSDFPSQVEIQCSAQ